jgi:hypothetical protein
MHVIPRLVQSSCCFWPPTQSESVEPLQTLTVLSNGVHASFGPAQMAGPVAAVHDCPIAAQSNSLSS